MPSPARAAAAPASDAQLRVTVLDQTGAALIIAAVTVVDSAGAAHTQMVNDKGLALFEGLVPGTYELKAEAQSFKTYEGPVTLKRGDNALTVHLPLASMTEEVVVQQSAADAQGHSFVSTLDETQIADLPDDPDELEQVLMQMAGPGAVMRVNGFRGGQLPPKSQIRQIRFRLNSYAAENHDAGGIGIDIITKPGMQDWRGRSTFAFRDESLNARNAFATAVGPEQYRRVGLDVNGPLVKGKTSIAFSTDGNFSYDSETVNAITPESRLRDLVRQPSDVSNVVARLEHALTARQTLMVEVQRHDDRRENLGVGSFNLPTRAYTRRTNETVVRSALNGLLAPKIANELRVQFSGDEARSSSLSTAPAVVVIDAFSTGGAGQQSRTRTRSIEIDDNVDFALNKKHAVRAGMQLEGFWLNSLDQQNQNGTFTFASLDAYARGLPNTFTERRGGTPVDFAQYQLGVYVQDDWTISKALSVSGGLRQELQNTLGDRLNLAPRLGFTWSPSKWTFRGGWGIFNDWYESSLYEQTLLVNGLNERDLVILQPGYPDPLGGTLAEPLPPSIVAAAAGLAMPHIRQASIGVERSWGDLRVQTNYMAQRSTDALRSRNVNAPVPGLGRPDPSLGNLTHIEATGRLVADRFNLNVNVAKPQRRLFLAFNYILSRTRNDADSALALPSNSLDPGVDFGPSSQDARHRIFFLSGFGLPLKLRAFAISQFTSALPYNIITGLDDNGDSVTNDRPAGVGRNSARGSASWNVNLRLSRSFSFGPQRQAGPGGPMPIGGGRGRGGFRGGDGPRFIGGGPGDPNAPQGRYSMEFYVQAFNLLNRANFTAYSGNMRSVLFGEPVAAGPARRIELGVQFGF